MKIRLIYNLKIIVIIFIAILFFFTYSYSEDNLIYIEYVDKTEEKKEKEKWEENKIEGMNFYTKLRLGIPIVNYNSQYLFSKYISLYLDFSYYFGQNKFSQGFTISSEIELDGFFSSYTDDDYYRFNAIMLYFTSAATWRFYIPLNKPTYRIFLGLGFFYGIHLFNYRNFTDNFEDYNNSINKYFTNRYGIRLEAGFFSGFIEGFFYGFSFPFMSIDISINNFSLIHTFFEIGIGWNI